MAETKRGNCQRSRAMSALRRAMSGKSPAMRPVRPNCAASQGAPLRAAAQESTGPPEAGVFRAPLQNKSAHMHHGLPHTCAPFTIHQSMAPHALKSIIMHIAATGSCFARTCLRMATDYDTLTRTINFRMLPNGIGDERAIRDSAGELRGDALHFMAPVAMPLTEAMCNLAVNLPHAER